MRTKIYLIFIFHFSFLGTFISQISQIQKTPRIKDTIPFNYAYWNGVADKQHLDPAARKEFIEGQKKLFEEQQHQHPGEDGLIWITEPAPTQKGYGQNSTNAGPCTNVDFESGTFTGWTRSTGFNPLFNVAGCCAGANGDQTIMTGGNDPFGGFPRVYPGGGSFSARLGSATTGGIADRLSQTFFVTAANANFTYRYAAVLNDGGTNHSLAQQPRFTSEIIDSLGNPVVCTFYQASAGPGAIGYTTSSLTPANGSAVSYRNWTDVAVDLSPNIGQNVTLRFTVYDCGPSGHFAYAYIDGICTNFATSVADTTCPNVPLTICAPTGFSTTTWNGPGFANDPNRCINVTLPGTYTCTTVLVPGCPGPTFTHTLTTLSPPLLSFTPVTTGVCAPQYTFNSTMGIASGSIASHTWYFGDGTTSSAVNPVHNYASPGTYPVKLRAVSNRGCMDSVTNFITIFPFPNLAFSPPSNCINTLIQFTNTSSIPMGSITSYTWNFFGNGPNSNSVNPTNTYSANGTYSITLTGISNQGCVSSLTQTLGIFPPPIISFSADPLCDINGTSFTPATSTAIASGSLAQFFWDFGDGGTSNSPSPVHIYAMPGVYTVSFTAISNHNCSASVSNSFSISPSPTIAFSTTSLNACSPTFTFTNNSGISVGPISYTWNFGGGNTTSSVSPTYTFPSIGDYTVTLIGASNMGCRDTAVQYISIYPLPVINFSVPASCENAIFTVSTTAVSGSVTSYNWDFGDPGSGAANTSTLQNPTHFYSTTNNYMIVLNIISNLNCPSTYSTPIVVYPNPVAAFSYSTLNNCSLPYTFINSSSTSTIGGSVLAGFNWNFGGVPGTQTATTFTNAFPANGSYSVSLIAITNHNCSDTVGVNILVHPAPQLAFTVMPSCHDIPVTFNSTSSISPVPSATSSILSYTWDYGDNSYTNTATAPPHSYSVATIYTVSFGATSNMGCTSLVTHTVEVYPSPIIDFTTGINMCFGNPTQFTSTNSLSPPTGTLYAFNWDFGDGTLGSNPTISHTYSTSGSFPVTYSVTSNHECLTVLTKNVTIHPLPAPTFTVNNGCLNTTSLFTGTATISLGSITSYSYDFGDGTGLNAQTASKTYLVAQTYTAILTATSNQGCVNSATNTVVIHPLPTIAFSPPGACEASVIQFTNNSFVSPIGFITSYQWDFADGSPTSTLSAPTHSFLFGTNNGVYQVSLTATTDQGCSTTSVTSLNIYPYPQVTVTTINNACENDNISINPNITITGNNPVSYTVSFGDGSPLQTYSTPTLSIPHIYTAHNPYTITVSASSMGCSTLSTAQVTIYPKPFPSFSANKFCKLDSTTFANTSTIAATYSIDAHYWYFGDGVDTSGTKNPKHVFSGDGTYTVQLIEYSHPNPLYPSFTCSMSTVNTIIVNPLPGSNFTNNTACAGAPTSFSNTSTLQNNIAWSWDFYNNGQINSIAHTPTPFTYTTPSTYTYTAKLKALNTFGCRDSALKQVFLHTNPTALFSAPEVCLGQGTTFTNSSFPGSGTSLTYTWNMGNSYTVANANATYTFLSAQIHTVQLTAADQFGCTHKYTGTVVVNPLPSVNFSSSETCLGQTTSFINSSGVAVGVITSYTWSFGDAGSGANNISNQIIPPGGHLYTTSGPFPTMLSAITDKGCQADTTKTVVVHAVPTADFTHTTICVGDKLAFTNLSSSPDGSLVLNQWDFNGDNLTDVDEPSPTYTYTQPGNYLIKLLVLSEHGCVDTAIRQGYANPKAVASFSSNNKGGCPPVCVNFRDLSSISSGSFSTTWDFGDGEPGTNTRNPSRCFNSGSYDVNLTLVSDVGCITKFKHPGYVSVFPVPTAGFKVEPEEVDEDEPVINVTNLASSDVTSVRYYVNDGASFTSTDFTHYIKNLKQTKPVVVQVVKNQYGCSDTLFKLLEIKPSFVIYIPNVFTPNGDGLNDDFLPKGVGIIKFAMQIYDRWGHQVFRTNDITETWDGTTRGGGETIKEDVYTWKAQVTDIFNKSHTMVGHVTVIK